MVPVLLLSALFISTAQAYSESYGKQGMPVSTEDQQGIVITGRVTSGIDNANMPGVSIVVRGTQRGTVTNSSGEYTIEVPGSDAVLVFSFIGYKTEEVTVGNQRVINLTMTESIEALDEVVVTALGITRREKSLGYSVGKVER